MGRPKGSKNKPKETSSTPEVTASDSPSTTQDTPQSTAAPAYTRRMSLLNEISQSNKERYAADEGEDETVDISDQEDKEQPEEVQDASLEATADVKPEVAPETKPDVQTPPKKKLVINGVEKELTENEILALAQKNAAADMYLAEAKRIYEDAKRREATQQGATHDDAIRQNGSTAFQPSSTPDDVGSELVSQITRAIIAGEEGDVQKAVEFMLKSGRQSATQPNINPQQIHGLVAETIAFESAKKLLETTPEQGGYADIWSDSMLREMFKRRENELRDGDPERGIEPDRRPYAELYQSIGNEIRQWREGIVKQYTPKTGLEDRDQLKRTTGIVRGGGGKVPTAPLESRTKSHDEVLSGMRRARGLN